MSFEIGPAIAQAVEEIPDTLIVMESAFWTPPQIMIVTAAATALLWLAASIGFSFGKRREGKRVDLLQAQADTLIKHAEKWRQRGTIAIRSIIHIAHPGEDVSGTLGTYKLANLYRRQKALECLELLETTGLNVDKGKEPPPEADRPENESDSDDAPDTDRKTISSAEEGADAA